VEIDLLGGMIGGERRLIAAMAHHGIESVGDQHNPSKDGDLPSYQSEGIAEAVISLVVVEDRLRNAAVKSVDRHRKTQFGVTTHVIELERVEWPRLGEDGRVYMYLADVVENADQSEAGDVGFFESHDSSQGDREVGNPVDMTVEILHHVLHGP
jgi:hypothetical protein